MQKLQTKLAIVIPCYNEEDVLLETTKHLTKILNDLIEKSKISSSSFILFVDDGSRDKTWEIIKNLSQVNNFIKGIRLSKNRGHQNALVAGLQHVISLCDFSISMDVDLQDDPYVIEQFVDAFYSGNDVVYGVRSDRKQDTLFKRKTAEFFYFFMKKLGVDLVFNHADYRLASHKALTMLAEYQESHLFLRGLFPLIGLKQTRIYYERNSRYAGQSKYNLRKMLSFAWDGVSSFSIRPLRIISIIGFVMVVLTSLLSCYFILAWLQNRVIQGWSSLILSIYFLGSVQLLAMGVVGEYIGKIYIETKRRPRYFIDESI